MFHKEGVAIIFTAFVVTAALIISIDYFEIKYGLPVQIFLLQDLLL